MSRIQVLPYNILSAYNCRERVENHIVKVTAEILVSLGAELKEISNQVCKYLGHYCFYI